MADRSRAECGYSSRFTRLSDQLNAPESRSHVNNCGPHASRWARSRLNIRRNQRKDFWLRRVVRQEEIAWYNASCFRRNRFSAAR